MTIRALLVTALFALGGCSNSHQRQEAPPQNSERIDAVKASPSPDARKLQTLQSGMAAIKLGDTEAEVTARLGAADRVEVLGPKRGHGWGCRGLAYDIALVGKTPGNVNDQIVEFLFSRKDGKLIAVSSSVTAIPRRGDATICLSLKP